MTETIEVRSAGGGRCDKVSTWPTKVQSVKQTSRPGRRSYSLHGIDITVSADTVTVPHRINLQLRWFLRGQESDHGSYLLCEVESADAADVARYTQSVRSRLKTIVGELVARPEHAIRIDYLAVTLTR